MRLEAARRRFAGLCGQCGEKAVDGKTWCQNHIDLAASSYRRRHATMKARVLGSYGDRCKCCGEAKTEFLVIDHIKNDGNTHRKQLKRAGISLYSWLIKNEFPAGFQVLCHNCNWAKHTPGRCPHCEDEIIGCLSECG